MTTGNGDDRQPTLHGEPVPLPTYPTDDGDRRPPPRRDSGWLVTAVAAAVVLVIGLVGLLAWMVLHGHDSETPAAVSETRPATVVPAAPAGPQSTVPPRTVTVTPATPGPQAGPDATGAPQTSDGGWYAQFGAFNDYSNALAEAGRHYGAVIRSGSDLGLSSRYVVVRPAASEAEARAVCSHFAEGTCYVRSR